MTGEVVTACWGSAAPVPQPKSITSSIFPLDWFRLRGANTFDFGINYLIAYNVGVEKSTITQAVVDATATVRVPLVEILAPARVPGPTSDNSKTISGRATPAAFQGTFFVNKQATRFGLLAGHEPMIPAQRTSRPYRPPRSTR